MVGEGHDVGHHSYFHSEPSRTSTSALLAEVRQCRELLEDITGSSSNLFRPPKGKLTARKLCGLLRAQQTIVLWNVDSLDCRLSFADDGRLWARNYKPTAGNLVLMHDDRAFAATAIPQVAAQAANAGLSFEPVSNWIAEPTRQRAVCHRPASEGQVSEGPAAVLETAP